MSEASIEMYEEMQNFDTNWGVRSSIPPDHENI